MATIDFPASPILNQQYAFNTRYWFWDGAGWERFYPTGGVGQPATTLNGPWIEVGGLFAVPYVAPTDPITWRPTLLTHI